MVSRSGVAVVGIVRVIPDSGGTSSLALQDELRDGPQIVSTVFEYIQMTDRLICQQARLFLRALDRFLLGTISTLTAWTAQVLSRKWFLELAQLHLFIFKEIARRGDAIDRDDQRPGRPPPVPPPRGRG